MGLLRITGRVLCTGLIFAWWSLGVGFALAADIPTSLIYGVPLELVGLVMAWKVSDPDRPNP